VCVLYVDCSVAGVNPTVAPRSFTVHSHSYNPHTRTVQVFWQVSQVLSLNAIVMLCRFYSRCV